MRDRLRHALLIAAAVSGFAIFGAFAVYEEPGLGLGHFFYVPIILAALATGPAISAGAAVIATAMYASGVIINSGRLTERGIHHQHRHQVRHLRDGRDRHGLLRETKSNPARRAAAPR
jgi:hypothetical protein